MSTDNFKDLFSDYWSKIEALLSGETPGNIFNDINHSFMKKYIDAFNGHMNGGKRLRAFLVILGYNIAGRETDNENAEERQAFGTIENNHSADDARLGRIDRGGHQWFFLGS